MTNKDNKPTKRVYDNPDTGKREYWRFKDDKKTCIALHDQGLLNLDNHKNLIPEFGDIGEWTPGKDRIF